MSLLGTALVLLALTEDVRLVASGLTVGGIMLGALFAALSACVAGRAPRERAVESFGWFGAAGSVGAALSLVAGGYSIETAGASAGW
jgi:MFS family permease